MNYEITIERVMSISVIIDGDDESDAKEIALSMSEDGLVDWNNPDSWFTEVIDINPAEPENEDKEEDN